MGSVILREALADRERLGVTDVLENGCLANPVAGLQICGEWEEDPGSPLLPTLLIVPPAVQSRMGQSEALLHSAPLSLGHIRCVALAETHEIPPSLRRFSVKTGAAVFASRFDAWLLKSRLVGLLAEKADRRVTVHGVLVQVADVGVLITGESGIGKTLCSLELARSGERWVADDAVVLEGRGDALYGRAHERTKGLIALRGRGICRAEGVLGRAALRDTVRVELIVRMRRGFRGKDHAAGSLPPFIRKIVGVSLYCWPFTTDGEPHRMALGVRGIVRAYLVSSACEGPDRIRRSAGVKNGEMTVRRQSADGRQGFASPA